MIDFIRNTLLSRWPEILGLLLTLTSGFLVPWLSKKSGNYKKLNKKMVLICLLHLVYLSVVPLTISTVGIIVLTVVVTIAEIALNMTITVIFYTFLSAMTLLIFFGVMRISKRMRILTEKAKEGGKLLHPMLSWVAILSIVLSYANLAFMGTAHQETVYVAALAISWALQILWLCIMAAIVWKTSEYVYSKIKITMMDDKVYDFDCSPKVYRVYRNYVRVFKRDENGAVIHEMQINEIAIKQIEYMK